VNLPGPEDFRRAADLVRASAAEQSLKVQAILAKRATLPGLALALAFAVQGLNPVVNAADELERIADQVEFADWNRGRD
jgi:hypothetical protein